MCSDYVVGYFYTYTCCEMQLKPTEVNHFEAWSIIAVGAGDEFSLAVDSKFHPWGWGRAEQGQVYIILHCALVV